MTSQLVWLITGTSTGLGRGLTLAALKRGDKVIATGRARSLSKLEDLKTQGADTLELDVTVPLSKLQEIARKAVEIHGRIDVVVNNAGYILVGPIEESIPEETLDQFKAFLPYMRERKTGTIVFFGSLGGWRSVPNAGLYASTKFAVRGISETLHAEISPLGLRSICFDFGYFRTSFLTSDHRAPVVSRISDYKPMVEKAEAALQAYNGKQPGDPLKGVEVILDVVRGEGAAAGKSFPITLSLGSDCFDVVKASSEATLARMYEWEEVTKSTDFA